jgi:prophage antirepressor-like protein
LINVIIDNDNIPWFNGNDIAVALGYTLPKKAISNNVDEEDKTQLEDINTDISIDKHPHSMYINESGLYSLIIASRLPKAKKFKKWVTSKVIPSIRKYGYYKLEKKHENEHNDIMKKLNFIMKENEIMKNELKSDKFPEGGLVYVIDYSDDDKEVYRIGKTGDMKIRKNVYDTHTLYKKKVIHTHETDCPIQLETCVRAMLYKFRVKNKKDFYECDKKTIIKAFKACVDSFDCMNQKGGNINFDETIKNLEKKKENLKNKLVKVKEELNKNIIVNINNNKKKY